MKRTKCAAVAGIVLALLCTLTGCPQEAGDPEIDSGLVHKWTDNGDTESYLERKFEIQSDGAFTADLNPAALGAYAQAYAQAYANAFETTGDASAATTAAATAGTNAAKGSVDGMKAASIETSWHVTGKLTQVEGTLYKMDDLEARASDLQVVPGTPPTTTPANDVIGNFSGQNITIIVAPNGNSFTFSHGGTDEVANQINLFFGGTYHKAD